MYSSSFSTFFLKRLHRGTNEAVEIRMVRSRAGLTGAAASDFFNQLSLVSLLIAITQRC